MAALRAVACCASADAPVPPPPPPPPPLPPPPCESFRGQDTAVRLCTSRSCRQAGAQKLATFMQLQAEPAGVTVLRVGCLGRCGEGPNAVFLPSGEEERGIDTKGRALEALLSHCRWCRGDEEGAPHTTGGLTP